MIDVKEAARKASEYFANLYSGQDYSDVQLEEVELTEDEKSWLITLSYAYREPSPVDIIVPPTIFSPKQRKYKLFKIDSETGKVQAMKIRSLN